MGAAVQAALSRWGRIDAVIHAAGVAGDGQLSVLKTAAGIDAVLAPKVGGLQVLKQLLGDTPLEKVVLMSSINSVLGAPGVADYASANAVLDAFAESAEVPAAWRHVVAFDWGAWREVGMAAKLEVPAWRRTAWDAYLQTAIGTEEGLMFERARGVCAAWWWCPRPNA
jgi:NAD(P)-dependent dehydrogenase (short-subunit alcohol dehydrogenase family)